MIVSKVKINNGFLYTIIDRMLERNADGVWKELRGCYQVSTVASTVDVDVFSANQAEKIDTLGGSDLHGYPPKLPAVTVYCPHCYTELLEGHGEDTGVITMKDISKVSKSITNTVDWLISIGKSTVFEPVDKRRAIATRRLLRKYNFSEFPGDDGIYCSIVIN